MIMYDGIRYLIGVKSAITTSNHMYGGQYGINWLSEFWKVVNLSKTSSISRFSKLMIGVIYSKKMPESNM